MNPIGCGVVRRPSPAAHMTAMIPRLRPGGKLICTDVDQPAGGDQPIVTAPPWAARETPTASMAHAAFPRNSPGSRASRTVRARAISAAPGPRSQIHSTSERNTTVGEMRRLLRMRIGETPFWAAPATMKREEDDQGAHTKPEPAKPRSTGGVSAIRMPR